MRTMRLAISSIISALALAAFGCGKPVDTQTPATTKHEAPAGPAIPEQSTVSSRPSHRGIFGIVYRPNMAFAVSDESTKVCAESNGGWKDAYASFRGEDALVPMCWKMSTQESGMVYMCMVEKGRIVEAYSHCKEFPEDAFIAPRKSVFER